MSIAHTKRYLVIRTDEHGTKYLIAKVLSAKEAADDLQVILDQQLKPHHQTYDVIEYEVGSLKEVLDREGIRE